MQRFPSHMITQFIYKTEKWGCVYPSTRNYSKHKLNLIEKEFAVTFSFFKPDCIKFDSYNTFLEEWVESQLAMQSNRVRTKLAGGKWVGGAKGVRNS